MESNTLSTKTLPSKVQILQNSPWVSPCSKLTSSLTFVLYWLPLLWHQTWKAIKCHARRPSHIWNVAAGSWKCAAYSRPRSWRRSTLAAETRSGLNDQYFKMAGIFPHHSPSRSQFCPAAAESCRPMFTRRANRHAPSSCKNITVAKTRELVYSFRMDWRHY